MTKTATKAKRNPKTTGKGKVSRTPGKAKTLADVKSAKTEDDDILAALDDEATSTADDILADIEAAETVDKDAIYEEQESTLSVDDTDKKDDAPKAKRKSKSANGEAKAPRPKREINMTKLAEIYPDGNAMVTSIETLPKKVQDKARNALLAMTTGIRLSQYTGYAIDALNNSGGTVEVGKLREILEDRGYKRGTASAQAQQQMTLLPYLGVAERNGRMLTLKPGDALDALKELA